MKKVLAILILLITIESCSDDEKISNKTYGVQEVSIGGGKGTPSTETGSRY